MPALPLREKVTDPMQKLWMLPSDQFNGFFFSFRLVPKNQPTTDRPRTHFVRVCRGDLGDHTQAAVLLGQPTDPDSF